MSIFTNCIEWVLQLEDRGLTGIVKDLGDGAGLTRFGISQKNNPNVPPAFFSTYTSAEALAEAKVIYYGAYWVPSHAGDFQTDLLAATHLSFSVNAGVSRGLKVFQQVLGVTPIDGHYGPVTLAAVEHISDEAAAAGALRAAQEAFYQAIGGPNLAGWLHRVRAVYPDLP